MNTLAFQEFAQHRFPISVEMYHLMAEKGVFHPDDRVELIEGELIDMSPIGTLHARCVAFLNRFLSGKAGSDYIIVVQSPIVLSDSTEPQPDISMIRYQSDFYKNHLPGPKE